VLAGLACRRPATALPHSPLSLPYPTADTRPSTRLDPTCQSRPHRVGRTLSLSSVARQRRRPCLIAGGHRWPPHAVDRHARGPISSSLCHTTAPPMAGFFFPSLPRATEALEKPPAATHSLFLPFSYRPRPSSSSSPLSPLPMHLPRWLPPPETPPPLMFLSERHRLCRFTVRSSHPPPLSPIEDALTFPLPH
jgi:hypothetical protein